MQIEFGLLTDPQGRPGAVRVFEGNTADPTAFTEIAGVVKNTFGLKRMVMAGDRGMITSARIEALKELDDQYAWITALRAPAIRKLMAEDGPLQLSLFDEQDLAEITSPDFPGERLIACRNPVLAEERARKREDLLAATEKLLAPRHPRAQRAALPRHPCRRPRPHHPHQPPARSLRPHRIRHPAHPEKVARNRRQARRESAGQRRSRHPQAL